MTKSIQLTDAEQQKLLENSILIIKSEIHQMRKCLESKHKFMDSLKHASNFLNELRTSSLNPKQYYELYILVYDGLSYLSNYLKDNTLNSNTKSTYLIDLYELVQYAGNIIPRLYLMITIGTVYMGSNDAPVNEILNDMLEMCKGVQNPIRGLFLRYYLIQITKNYLIDQGNNINNNNNSKDKKDLDKIVHFIILNFIEMNKLWVRLQFQGHSSEKNKRIEERNELKILVGSNLVILSQLDSVDLNYYNSKILPQILQQIIKCNDSIAQNYLLDVIIQIFPDNFQINSLTIFLNTLIKVKDNINLNSIFSSLINRFINYKKRDSQNSIDYSFFQKFVDFINQLNNDVPDFDLSDYSNLLTSILDLTLTFNDENISQNLNTIYKLALDKLELTESHDASIFKKLLTSIENFPMNKSSPILLSFNDENYFKLFKLQNNQVKNEICVSIISNLLENNIIIDNLENLNHVIKYINESLEILKNTSLTKEDLFGKEPVDDKFYLILNSFINLIKNDDVLIERKLLLHLNESIPEDNLIPTIISKLLIITRKMKLKEIENIEIIKTFNIISKLINKIKLQNPINALNFNLFSAQISNECNFSNLTYDFFIESFLIYEELIIESKIQYQCLMNIINKLYLMNNLITNNIEDFDKLVVKVTLYGSRLMKKTDQCRAIYNSSHLWWINKIEINNDEDNDDDDDEDIVDENQIILKREDKRVLECLQKSLRIADSIMDIDVSIELFVEILNQSLYYFIHGNETINIRYINGLIELISNNFKEISTSDSSLNQSDETYRHFQRTLNYIKEQRSVDPRFHEISILDLSL
ncbi:hypothetical protein CANINC_003887 [Pichia inconspicua]|uniref:Vacuolar protein sorting-associated protein 35 n=1 Tax=Pichia inconspicua TaxID=52247 RepID=A0A4T0WXF8_9ASCO|nr:hypothetical protein CANINC_003887 [[Candida] inconspicua]